MDIAILGGGGLGKHGAHHVDVDLTDGRPLGTSGVGMQGDQMGQEPGGRGLDDGRVEAEPTPLGAQLE